MIDPSICVLSSCVLSVLGQMRRQTGAEALLLFCRPDRGPAGARASLSHGGGGGRLQRASDPHHPRRRLALLLHQLPLRSQPAASPPQEGVRGQDELQGGGSARQGGRRETQCASSGGKLNAEPELLCSVHQGRSLRESTLRRAQRRSFTPASFMEEDMVDFPDELDTSFFARVRQTKKKKTLTRADVVT